MIILPMQTIKALRLLDPLDRAKKGGQHRQESVSAGAADPTLSLHFGQRKDLLQKPVGPGITTRRRPTRAVRAVAYHHIPQIPFRHFMGRFLAPRSSTARV